MERNITKVEHLREVLKTVEQTLVEVMNTLETDLALEIEKRKKAKAEVSKVKEEGEKRMEREKKRRLGGGGGGMVGVDLGGVAEECEREKVVAEW